MIVDLIQQVLTLRRRQFFWVSGGLVSVDAVGFSDWTPRTHHARKTQNQTSRTHTHSDHLHHPDTPANRYVAQYIAHISHMLAIAHPSSRTPP